MGFDAKQRLDLRSAVVLRASEEYKEYVRIGGVLEDKAQKVTVASGAFLAAGLGLLTSENARKIIAQKVGRLDFALLFVIISLLILATAAALRVTWVNVISVPAVEGLRQMTKDVLQLPDAEQTDDTLGRFYDVQAGIWITSVDSLRKKVKRKANWLLAAQTVFAGAVLCIAVVLYLTVRSL